MEWRSSWAIRKTLDRGRGMWERGKWQLTDAGRTFFAKHPSAIDPAEIEKIAKVPTDSRLMADPDSTEPILPQPAPSAGGSPDERIDQVIGELNDSGASELLNLIRESSPTFFEHLVLDLPPALGYGTRRVDARPGAFIGVFTKTRLPLDENARFTGARTQHVFFIGGIALDVDFDLGIVPRLDTNVFAVDAAAIARDVTRDGRRYGISFSACSAVKASRGRPTLEHQDHERIPPFHGASSIPVGTPKKIPQTLSLRDYWWAILDSNQEPMD